VTAPRLALGTCALGRALDADGSPLDGGPALRGRMVALQLRSPRPDERVPIATPFWTGVRVIDGLLTIGRGARIGIFGAPGSGKSTLLESVVEGCAADAAVVALVGERGREANDWIGRCNDRTTIVCATSDRPAEVRLRAAHVAFAHAAALRERGLHVLLLLDSLARVASALREIAVARGESAGRGGFPPSVFADMARLVEVAGALADGSITLIATVIHDGDDRDPVSEAARALLDGHVVLALRLAEAGRFPAVDVPASASRTMDCVVAPQHRHAALRVRRALALLERVDDARALGIEPAGGDAAVAVASEHRIEAFLRQSRCPTPNHATLDELETIARSLAANR
jgi:FliI/YscN family ATPase